MTISINERQRKSLDLIRLNSGVCEDLLLTVACNYYLQKDSETTRKELDDLVLLHNEKLNYQLLSSSHSELIESLNTLLHMSDHEMANVDDVINILEPTFHRTLPAGHTVHSSMYIPIGARMELYPCA